MHPGGVVANIHLIMVLVEESEQVDARMQTEPSLLSRRSQRARCCSQANLVIALPTLRRIKQTRLLRGINAMSTLLLLVSLMIILRHAAR